MSWNPFSRHSAPKKSVVSRASERGFEKEVKKLDELDESTRRLYKDAKKFVEANNALAKVEHRLVQDLLGSGLCHREEELRGNVEEWDRCLDNLDKHRQELNTITQKALVEPMKKFSGVFPSVTTAMKKREQSLQEYNRCQARVEKYQERDRTGTNVVKLEYTRRALDAAKEEFQTQNEALKQDLPRLYEGRIEYFQPSLEALLRSQISYSSEAYKTYSTVSSDLFGNSKLSEQERKSRINQTLNEIRSLSITVDQ